MTPSEGPQPKTEQASQAPQVAKPGAPPAGDRWKKPFANAFKLVGIPRQATGSTRQIVDAALLGMCLVFFVAFLGHNPLDSSLTGAAIAFAITVPLLVNGYVFTSKVDQHGPGWRVLGALQIGAWIGEGVGEFTAALGLYFVLAHFAPRASLAFVLAIVGVLLIPVLSAIGTDIYSARLAPRTQGQLKPEELQTPAPPAPPEQGTTL